MKTKLMTVALAATIALTGCTGNNTGQPVLGNMGTKQTIGTAGGAIAGGLLGSKIGGGSGQLWATGAGALLGAFVGSSIGASLDRADMQYYNQANQQAHNAPVGQTINWNNPQSGNYGSITPVRDGRSASGLPCREYRQTIVVDGRAENATGRACQQPDGSWQLVS